MNGDPERAVPGSTNRRMLFAGVGAVGAGALLAACGDGGAPGAGGQGGQPRSGGGTPAAGGQSGDRGGGQADDRAGEKLASVGDVEVGGGLIIATAEVVVTQPTEGQFFAFSVFCTHQGCMVSSVSDGTINCPCHGSRYSIEDGSVVRSAPGLTTATQSALPPVDVEVDGDSIVRA